MMDSFAASDQLRFMSLALDQARMALARMEVPVGCVVVENGRVIGSGSNRTNETRNATRHAEMEAIDELLALWMPLVSQDPSSRQRQLLERFRSCELYVTCEPCIMCAAAISILGIKKVFYGCANDRFGGCSSVMSLHINGCGPCGISPEGNCSCVMERGFKCTGGLMADVAIALLREFYEQGNPNAPRPHRPLLSKADNDGNRASS